jgi:hypothetical protein
MANNKKPRKAYKPKRLTSYGGLYTVASRAVDAKPLTDDERQKVVIDYYAAISAMAEGRGTEEHFDSLAYAGNTAQIITRYVFTDADKPLVFNAMCAINRTRDRYLTTNKMGVDGDGLQALRDFGPLFEAILEQSTAGELQAARLEMARRLDRGQYFEARAAA